MNFVVNAQQAEKIVEAQLANANHFDVPQIPREAQYVGEYKIFNLRWKTDGELGYTGQPRELGTLGTFMIHAAETGFLWDYEPGKSPEGPYDTSAVMVTREGTYYKRECRPGEIAYSRPTLVPKIIREGNAVNLRKIAFTEWSGADVCNDILGIGPFKKPQQSLVAWGAFRAAGNLPTREELEKALAALTKTFRDIWQAAQSLHKGGRTIDQQTGIDNISELAREADRFLGRQAEWNKESEERRNACPYCGVQTRLDVAFCPQGCVLDVNKALASGRITEERALQLLEQRGQSPKKKRA